MGCRAPGADSPDTLWQLLRAGHDAVTPCPPDGAPDRAAAGAYPPIGGCRSSLHQAGGRCGAGDKQASITAEGERGAGPTPGEMPVQAVRPDGFGGVYRSHTGYGIRDTAHTGVERYERQL
ncbi:beta-ketoacyl synthase N-terminal-like domain-containing protein [Catellatospora sichuanensis]|uniref:beta-ketoacyl synthase N-terminal-like domain-containing protein n=1 Tax=Catellatospora sichuanensis TaxID=1969805 RepID=UPI003CCC7691